MDITSIHVSPGDTVVVRFDTDEHDLHEIAGIMNAVKQQYPQNAVMSLPTDIGIEIMDDSALLNLYQFITAELKSRAKEYQNEV